MLSTLIQMVGLIACGIAWRLVNPGGLNVESTRTALTGLVYYIFLPGLVLLVLWQAPLNIDAIRISFVAASSVIAWLFISWFVYRLLHTPKAITGALLLAAAFPNATYLGLPVLENVLGTWARSIAIQYDLFACTPLLLTIGILVARAHSKIIIKENPFIVLLKVPPLWAAFIAILLNSFNIDMPMWLQLWLESLASAVVPLMLISLGMGLRWHSISWNNIVVLLPVFFVQLLLMPALALALSQWVGLTDEILVAVILEAAMPSMILGIVICDQYKLDTLLYASAVTLSTLLSLITLPIWHNFLI